MTTGTAPVKNATAEQARAGAGAPGPITPAPPVEEQRVPLRVAERPAPRPGGLPPGALLLVVAGIDAALIALAFLAATAIRVPPNLIDMDLLPTQIFVVGTLMLAGLGREGAYELQRVPNGEKLLTSLGLGSLVGLCLIMLASYVVPEVGVGRGVFAIHAALAIPILFLWRRFLLRLLRAEALRPRTLILGEPELGRRIARALERAGLGGAEVVGLLVPKAAATPGATPTADPAGTALARGAAPETAIVGAYERLEEAASTLGVAQVVVVAGTGDADLPLEQVLALRRAGVLFLDGPSAYEAVTGKILVDKLTPGWLVFASAFETRPFNQIARRALEAAAAGLALLVSLPVLGAVALAVRVSSPGPVLYKQRRVGQGGRTFELLKFRSMCDGAEAKTGAVWAKAEDPRVTRVGRVLRSTRLDELPQLWNVLRGDMSFVGPRPERPELVERIRKEVPLYDQRHTVKPGITGWAQINYPYGASVEDSAEKLAYDLFYIQNMSLILDLEIVLGTIRVVFGVENRH